MTRPAEIEQYNNAMAHGFNEWLTIYLSRRLPL